MSSPTTDVLTRQLQSQGPDEFPEGYYRHLAAHPSAEEVRKYAVLSDDAVYRYSLIRNWSDPDDPGYQFATFVMLNPSKADATDDDPTIQRCMKFARSWGLQGIKVVNLYAFRATQPPTMWAAMADGTDIIGPDNESTVQRALYWARNYCLPVVAAWGNHGAPERVDWIRREADILGVQLQCLGTTLSGAPKHPLARGKHRIPDDTKPMPWLGQHISMNTGAAKAARD